MGEHRATERQSRTNGASQQAIRRGYSELIGALQSAGRSDEADQCASMAVEHGLWRDPRQRPVSYVPSIAPVPVHDPATFWFVRYLEESYPLIRAEIDAVIDPGRDGFLPVEEPLLNRGEWEQITFYESGQRYDDACSRFPITASIMESIPEATSAGAGVVTLSWLHPGSHIVPHCGGTNARLRVHLGLRVPDGPVLRVGDELLHWSEGRCLVFDDSFEHEVWHDGTSPRIVLLFDVPHPDFSDTVRLVRNTHQPFAEKIGTFMRERGITRVELEDNGDVRMNAGRGTASLVRRHLREIGSTWVELRDGKVSYGE